MKFIKEIKISFIITSIVSILLGVFFVAFPATVQNVIAVILGIILTVLGVVWVITFFRTPGWTFGASFYLFFGAIFIGMGLWMAINPTFFNKIVVSIIGILIIINSFMALAQSISLRKVGYIRWWLPFLFACVAILLGALVVSYPLIFGSFAMQIIGAILIYNGISNLWITTRVHKYITNAEQEPEIINVDAVDVSEDD